MRGRSTPILVLGIALTVACAGIASAYKPTVIPIGLPPVELNGGFSPTKLPKNKLAPIKLNVSGIINTIDGTHPPAMQKVVLEIDKNGAVDARGLAACPVRTIEAASTTAAAKACKPAWVGEGEMEFEVELPEQAPFLTKSRAIAFNGGVHGGKTTIFIHVYLPAPVSAAIVTRVKISKVHNGRYGTRWVATIPSIADGSGSVKKFSLNFFRMFTYKGKKQSFLLARCLDGRLKARWEAKLADDSKGAGSFVRPCTPRD
jgi:hypothetical protein